MRIAVVNDYLRVAEDLADWRGVRRFGEIDFLAETYADEAATADALDGYDIICSMRERLPLTATLMDRLPRLKLFVATSETNRMIDFAAADTRGIEIAGTPSGGVARIATAELTWGLVLAATRGILREDAAIREGRWQDRAHAALHGLTIGIMGLGGVGRYIARFAHAFGMNVVAWSPHLNEMAAVESGAEAVTLPELLRRSDVVSLHLVLTESTRHILDDEAFALMKPSAVVVNTSRGPLIDEDALIASLTSGRIAGAALDVFEVEPLPAASPLRELTNVVLSPHAAGFTEQTYRAWYQGTADAVLAFLEGREIPVRHSRV